MRRIKKPVFFIVVVLIAVFAILTFNGVSTYYGDIKTSHIKGVDDIRWGIDISGGVDVTFAPPEGVTATEEQMDAAKAAIEVRLVNLGITDYELYVDYSNYDIIVRFPWQAGEENFDPEAAVRELGEMAELTFREGYETDEYGVWTGTTAENVIVTGDQVVSAYVGIYEEDGQQKFSVSLEFNEEGAKAFGDATTRLAASQGVISIWMDDTVISYPTVNDAITDGHAQITGSGSGFSYEEAKALADKISAGALPYKMVTSNFSTISPTLGAGARNAMVLAGVIAFVVICIYMIFVYRLAGVVASIALFGQVVGTIACITGFFGNIPSFTLTLPGIAGIILAVGMGVDANVVTFERVKEELRNGKGLYSALEQGYSRAWAAIFDGNITVVFVAVILMGAFGPPDSLFAKLMGWLYFAFPTTIEGTIYSFGYTLLVGVILNFVFGVGATRLMLASLSKFKAFREPKLYGVRENAKEHSFGVYKKRRLFYTVSGAVIVAAIVFSLIFGLNVAIEFKGGTIISYSYDGAIDENAVASAAQEITGETCSASLGESLADGETTVALSFPSSEGLTADAQSELTAALRERFASANLELYSSQDVDPSTGSGFFGKCIVAVIFSAVVMIIYIGLRFSGYGRKSKLKGHGISGFAMGCCSVVALIHDMFFVYACCLVFRFDIDSNFMAVLLTILGYSINATIIIYDRIRENRRLYGDEKSYSELTDMSISQSFGRSVHTTVTTVIAMATVCIVAVIAGVSSILSFAFPLVIGLLAGVYSSNCIAPTLWAVWQYAIDRRKEKKAKTE